MRRADEPKALNREGAKAARTAEADAGTLGCGEGIFSDNPMAKFAAQIPTRGESDLAPAVGFIERQAAREKELYGESPLENFMRRGLAAQQAMDKITKEA